MRKSYTCGACKNKRKRLAKSIREINGVKYCLECEPANVEAAVPASKKPGRPKGSKTRSDSITVVRGQCLNCGSTHRKILHTRTREIAGTLPLGQKYTSVVWRRCQCKECGRMRVEKSFEN